MFTKQMRPQLKQCSSIQGKLFSIPAMQVSIGQHLRVSNHACTNYTRDQSESKIRDRPITYPQTGSCSKLSILLASCWCAPSISTTFAPGSVLPRISIDGAMWNCNRPSTVVKWKWRPPKMGTPGPHFHMKLGTRVLNFLIFWEPWGSQFHMILGTLPWNWGPPWVLQSFATTMQSTMLDTSISVN